MKNKDPIEELFAQERWLDARRAIEEELLTAPNDHWLLTRLSTTYYEQGDYQTALHWVEQARALAPSCPLVLWDYAGTLDMLGRKREAVKVYVSLIDGHAEEPAGETCGEGKRWVRSLLVDSVFRCAACLEDLGRPVEAAHLYQRFLEARDLGIRGIYSRKDALLRLRHLAGSSRQTLQHTLDAVREELAHVG